MMREEGREEDGSREQSAKKDRTNIRELTCLGPLYAPDAVIVSVRKQNTTVRVTTKTAEMSEASKMRYASRVLRVTVHSRTAGEQYD